MLLYKVILVIELFFIKKIQKNDRQKVSFLEILFFHNIFLNNTSKHLENARFF